MKTFQSLIFLLISLNTLATVCASPERSFFEFELNKVNVNKGGRPSTLFDRKKMIFFHIAGR